VRPAALISDVSALEVRIRDDALYKLQPLPFLTAWLISVDLSPLLTTTAVSGLQSGVNCRFRGTKCQIAEDMLLYLCGKLL